VRDVGPQGRQECGAGRNRHLARRSGDLSGDVLRIAAAIVVDAGAFILWNLASRSPVQLARDVAAGISRPAIAARAAARIIIGLLLLAAGAALLLPLTIQVRTFTVLETWTVLTGLFVEQLIGADLRARRS
jgi:hypothetical protein